jgi:hypothetical protein
LCRRRRDRCRLEVFEGIVRRRCPLLVRLVGHDAPLEQDDQQDDDENHDQQAATDVHLCASMQVTDAGIRADLLVS